MKRAARSMRSGSSRNETSGAQRGSQALGGKVGRPTERVDEAQLGQLERHRVDREVAPRQVGLDVVGELHLRLAALGPVHVGAKRGDLDAHPTHFASDGAETLSLEPHVIGPSTDESLDLVGPRAGRDVDVVMGQVEQGIANAAADEIALMVCLGEAPGQLEHRRRVIEDRLEPSGHLHGAHCRGWRPTGRADRALAG